MCYVTAYFGWDFSTVVARQDPPKYAFSNTTRPEKCFDIQGIALCGYYITLERDTKNLCYDNGVMSICCDGFKLSLFQAWVDQNFDWAEFRNTQTS